LRLSLRESAVICDINHKTAFLWLNQLENTHAAKAPQKTRSYAVMVNGKMKGVTTKYLSNYLAWFRKSNAKLDKQQILIAAYR
jgi:hypothetical protein